MLFPEASTAPEAVVAPGTVAPGIFAPGAVAPGAVGAATAWSLSLAAVNIIPLLLNRYV